MRAFSSQPWAELEKEKGNSQHRDGNEAKDTVGPAASEVGDHFLAEGGLERSFLQREKGWRELTLNDDERESGGTEDARGGGDGERGEGTPGGISVEKVSNGRDLRVGGG